MNIYKSKSKINMSDWRGMKSEKLCLTLNDNWNLTSKVKLLFSSSNKMVHAFDEEILLGRNDIYLSISSKEKLKFRKIEYLELTIPNSFSKSKKYYYGVLDYLINEKYMHISEIKLIIEDTRELEKIIPLINYYKVIDQNTSEINLYINNADE